MYRLTDRFRSKPQRMPQDDNQDVYRNSQDEVSTDPGFAPVGAEAMEYDDSEVAEGGSSVTAQLAEANARADAEHDAFLRARADFANFKRRTEEERESLKTFLTSDLLTRFLPIVDNFERALLAAESTKDYDKLIGGVNAVYRQMQEFLTRAGVTVIDAVDQPFDPNLHNAVMREETTEYPENAVMEELQKGYALDGRVLRPTMVKVASGSE